MKIKIWPLAHVQLALWVSKLIKNNCNSKIGVYCEIALCQRNETITNDGTDEIEVVFALDRSGKTLTIF